MVPYRMDASGVKWQLGHLKTILCFSMYEQLQIVHILPSFIYKGMVEHFVSNQFIAPCQMRLVLTKQLNMSKLVRSKGIGLLKEIQSSAQRTPKYGSEPDLFITWK